MIAKIRLLAFMVVGLVLINGANAGDILKSSFLRLDAEMLTMLSTKRNEYKDKFLQIHPVILVLFSINGGQFALYRPNEKPIIVASMDKGLNYRLAGIVEHTVMVAYELAISYLQANQPQSKTLFINKMQSLQSNIKAALLNVNDLVVSSQEKQLYKRLLLNADNLIAQIISKNTVTQLTINNYLFSNRPDIDQLTKIVTNYQVQYWSQVLTSWQKLLGSQWDNTYAAVEYIYVHPDNNILLQLLLKHMSAPALNKRIFSFNTTSYAPALNEAMNLLMIKEPDHKLAVDVFGKGFLDYSAILPKTAIRTLQEQSSGIQQ